MHRSLHPPEMYKIRFPGETGPQSWLSADNIQAIAWIALGVVVLLALDWVRKRVWRWLAGRWGASGSNTQDSPPRVLLDLAGRDPITLHQAYQGILITGGIGSGKTTGPGAELARALLRQGAGVLVLCAKPDETDRWQRYCEETERSGDLMRVYPGGPYHWDVVKYELGQPGASVESVAQLLDILAETAQNNAPSGSQEKPFWRYFNQRIMRRALATVWLSRGTCCLTDVYKFIAHAPNDPMLLLPQPPADPRAAAEWHEWRKSFTAECFLHCPQDVAESRDFGLCADFWLEEWPNLANETRSSGYTQATCILDKFLVEPVTSLVSNGQINVSPDDVLKGKVVVLDMPVLQWREPGQFVQIMFKTSLQRAALKRSGGQPAVLWADEAQFFCVPSVDAMVQTVARQARLISVMITQNLPMLISALGGHDKAKNEAEGWIANLQTKIICQNSCKETNRFFEKLLGESKQLMMSGGSDNKPYDVILDAMGQWQGGGGHFSEQWHADVPAHEFTRLAPGGPENSFVVEFFAFQGGRMWSNGDTWIKAALTQRF